MPREINSLLKNYLRDKVESLVSVEENLSYSNDIINDLSLRCENANNDKDRLEKHYRDQFENIVDTLSSIKVYDKDTIQSDSLIDIINRSIREIKHDNQTLKKDLEMYIGLNDQLKTENERLNRKAFEHESLQHKFNLLKSNYDSLLKSKSLENTKRQLLMLAKNKIKAFKSEITYLKSS